MPLRVGASYSRVEVQRAIGISAPTHQGKWGTGYTEHDGQFYVFANVGIPGRTGHDYPNVWHGAILVWSAKSGTELQQPEIRKLLEPGRRCHIFTRDSDRAAFTYHGCGRPTNPRGGAPVMIDWVFD